VAQTVSLTPCPSRVLRLSNPDGHRALESALLRAASEKITNGIKDLAGYTSYETEWLHKEGPPKPSRTPSPWGALQGDVR